MAGGTKRLDLQFGSFACSVQGFENPVEPVQQVLRAMQTLLEESPELATAGIAFEADTIEQLIGEISRRADLSDSDVEIVPGLIIIHHGGLKRGAAPAEEAEPTGYVNIFAPASGGGDADFDDPAAAIDYASDYADDDADRVSDDDSGAEDTDHGDLVADRLGRMTAGSGDIFAESGEGASARRSGASVFADPMADDEAGDGGGEGGGAPEERMNFFSKPLGAMHTDGRHEAADELAGEEPVSGGPEDDDDGSLRLFTSKPAARQPEPAAEEPAAEPEPEQSDGGYTAAGLAESAQVTSVPDLMATAAAWMVLIKGQTTFSRKEILSVFETIPGEHEKSLESRIKGFGKAVRNGQLVMVEDGVFGLSRKEMERFQRAL